MAPLDASLQDGDIVAFVRDLEGGSHALDLIVEGAHCGGCISKIEAGLTGLDGVQTARLNLSTGRLAVTFTGEDKRADTIVQTLTRLGYPSRPYLPETAEDPRSKEEKRLLRCMAVAGFAMANIMLLSVAVWSGEGEMQASTTGLMHWISGLIALPASAYAGRPFFESAFRHLKAGQVNMDVPISLAVFLALGLSIYEASTGVGHTYFDASVMLLFFLLIGRYLDERLRARAGQAAHQLAAMQVSVAHRLNASGDVTAIPARDVRPGDRLLIAAGDRFPVDGDITDGTSSADAALVTGETDPVALSTGTQVYSGMVNLDAPVTMTATAARDDSLLSEITRLVEAGEQNRSRYVRLADHAARLYVPIVHTLALGTVIVWFVITGDIRIALFNAIAVLIITCPCALGLAVPAVQVVASGRLFREGILVKSGDALERLAQADHVVFDKTGTLTRGQPSLVNADTLTDRQIEYAARLARTSRHPISRAVANLAGMGETAEEISETPGQGLEGRVEAQRVRFGSASWLGLTSGENTDQLEAWLIIGDEEPVPFRFSDQLRDDAVDAITALDQQGLTSELLSGDRVEPVEAVATRLGIRHFHAGVKPQDKITRVHALKEDGHYPLMVGDGINDAPALAAAHVSVSMGSAAEISQSAADLVIQKDQLMALPVAIDIARASRRRVLENFGLAVAYNCIAVPLAVFGLVTPLIAAIAMSASSLLVTGNAMRLMR